MRKKENGFTLIELMVTIAVMAIIAMMAAPSFGNMMVNQKLKQNAIELRATLQQARSRAILTRTTTVVCPDKTAGTTPQAITQVLCGANLTAYTTMSPSQQADSVVLVPISQKVFLKTGSDLNFQFTAQGTSTVKKINLCGANRSYEINVLIPGIVTMAEGGAC